MRLWVYVIRRLLLLIPTLIGLTFIVFILSHVSGTNIILSEYINPRLTGAARTLLIQKLTSEFHLNQPIYVQYFYWLYQILQGNWGVTNTPIFSGSVTTAITLFFPNTIMIALVASILIWVIGVPLGVYSAVNRDSPGDHALRIGSFTLYAMPIYLIGVVLIILVGVYLKILPFSGVVNPVLVSALPWYVNGISYPTHIILIDAIIHGAWGVAWDAFLHLILPSVTLALAIIASMIRILRSSMLEVLDQDYIRLARSKGTPEQSVINLHARKNALLPVITLFGYTVAGLLGGVVVVETIFDFPGIGYWTTQALLVSDVGGIMASALLFGLVLVFANLIVDLIYAFVDPRIRY
ncbi:MAG TPA: ABC transporter permease [Candidatus Limnocylindrales bacterium]|nr:ABC transporter permease [Candidatus Limnocylindrales bacterium]